jgi:hypothetical protein
MEAELMSLSKNLSLTHASATTHSCQTKSTYGKPWSRDKQQLHISRQTILKT